MCCGLHDFANVRVKS